MLKVTPRAVLVRAALLLIVILAAAPPGSPWVHAQGPETNPGTGPFTARATLGRGMVRSAAWSPRGDVIAVGGALGIWLYTPDLGDMGLLKGHTKAVYGVAFSPDGATLASVSHDKTVRLWDVVSQTELYTLEGHTYLVVAVAWSPDGATVASGSYDGTVRLWDAATGTARAVLVGHTGWVNQVAYSPDGAALVSSSYDGTLRVWNPATGALRDTVPGTASNWHALTGQPAEDFLGPRTPGVARATSPDGSRTATADWDSGVTVRDSAGVLIAARQEHTDWIVGLAPDPDHPHAVVSLSTDHLLRAWDADTGALLSAEPADSLALPNPPVSPDGAWSAALDDDGTLRIVTLPDDVLAAEFPRVNGFAWLKDGQGLAVANRNGTITLWGTA